MQFDNFNFHYLVWDNPAQCKEILKDWDDYVKVNEAFAEKILEIYRVGDYIWILDHQLLLLPGILRKTSKCTNWTLFTQHLPEFELFRCLPQAEELLKGILGANLIGFRLTLTPVISQVAVHVSWDLRPLCKESIMKGAS